ncbi:MAG: hypothetical protein ACOYNL_01600 [Rickettsiales bacterium]
MEEKATRLDALKEKLSPPEHSTASIVLNGAGNGLMVGALPPLIYSLANQVTSEVAKKRQGNIALFSTVACTLVGAVYGLREAKHTEEYRHSVGQAVIDLRSDMDAHTQWAQRLVGNRQETSKELAPAK